MAQGPLALHHAQRVCLFSTRTRPLGLHHLAEMGAGTVEAEPSPGSWDTLIKPFSVRQLGHPLVDGGQVCRLRGWDVPPPSVLRGSRKQEGGLVSGTATSLSSSELHDWGLRAVTAPGALWSSKPKNNRVAERKGKVGLGGVRALISSRAPRSSILSIPQFSLLAS